MQTNDINKTAVVPYLIAEQVTDNIDEQNKLIERAERTFKNDATWRKQFNNSKDQREFLKMFFNHWVLCQRLSIKKLLR